MNSQDQTSLDHIGIVGPSQDRLEETFSALGFTVAPRCELMSIDADGNTAPLGQSNSHLVFGDTYVELTAVHGDPETHHLHDAIARYFGFHIVVLRTANAAAACDRLEQAGMVTGGVARAARDINYPDRQGTAIFDWFRVPPENLPEAFVCYVEHGHLDLALSPSLNSHPNGARELTGITLCADDSLAAARHFSAACDRPFSEGPNGANIILDGGGEVRFADLQQLGQLFPGVVPPPLPWAAAFTVTCEDLTSTGQWFKNHDVQIVEGQDRIWLKPDQAEGVIVEFVSG